MFWLRPAALRPLLDGLLSMGEFQAEGGQLDGTLAHAVERILSLIARSAGFTTFSAASLLGLPETEAATYSYALRSG